MSDNQDDQAKRDVFQKAMWRLSGKLRKESSMDAGEAIDHLLNESEKLSAQKNDETKE